jgi:hypothetical protein
MRGEAEGDGDGKLATMRKDGRPSVVPVWFDLDGETFVFTTWHKSLSKPRAYDAIHGSVAVWMMRLRRSPLSRSKGRPSCHTMPSSCTVMLRRLSDCGLAGGVRNRLGAYRDAAAPSYPLNRPAFVEGRGTPPARRIVNG